jgi:serine/threonine-protein kinase
MAGNEHPILAGRWRLEGMLGAGGMGVVYLARDIELDETVALKMLTHATDEDIIAFRDEVKLARRVTHANVARTFDIGEHLGTRFLTMEHVAGGSLRRLLSSARLPRARALGIARQICAGLAAVHAAGIVHGDLKPENVLLTAEGVVKLSDFGIARLTEGAAMQGFRGTLEYAAPELLAGATPDPRSDVFALGIVLCELYGGGHPWGESPNLAGEPPRVPDHVPLDVARLVLACLAADPAARPPSAADVGAALAEPTSTPSLGVPHVRATRPAGGALRVAVRALLAEDEGDTYLGVALASDVSRLLATAPELAVVAVPADADAVVDGSVTLRAMTLRMNLRLVSCDGFLLWARAATVPLSDVLPQLESSAAAIAAALAATTRPRAAAGGLRDPKLLELYLRARHRDELSWHDMSFDNSALYAELLAVRPDDPLLLASYATSLMHTAFVTPGHHARARDAAERALRNGPDLAEAHLALATVLFVGNELEGAVRAIVRALELAPSLAAAHSILGSMLAEIGRAEDALARFDLALGLDSRLGVAAAEGALTAALAGQLSRAEGFLARAPVAQTPASEWLYWVTRMRVAIYTGGEGAKQAARDLAKSPFAGVPPLSVVLGVLTRTATMEQVALAASVGTSAEFSLARARATAHAIVAEVAAHLGDADAAVRAIAATDAEGTVDIRWIERCRAFDPLRARIVSIRKAVAARAQRLEDMMGVLGVIVMSKI